MLKKITSILVAGAMVTAMAISAGAENYDKKIDQVYSSESIMRASSYSYSDFSINNGYTMILGNSKSNDGYFYIDAGTTVTLTTKLTSNQTALDMGYYYNGSYTECGWSNSGPSWGKYTYTCTMTISKAGNYKFFISNNTANTLSFTGTSVAF